MGQSIAKSFTATGQSGNIVIKHNRSFSYAVSGTFVGTVVLEKSNTGGATWEAVVTKTAAASDTLPVVSPNSSFTLFRFNCTAYTSGTIVTSMVDTPNSLINLVDDSGTSYLSEKDDGTGAHIRAGIVRKTSAAGAAKVGGTAGFVVAAAANTALVTCPQSITAGKCVIPLHGFKVGDTITGYYIDGAINSAGGAVTVDCDLFVQTAAASGVTSASLGTAMTQLSKTAQTIMDDSNTSTTLATPHVIGSKESIFALVTVTTAASTDITLIAVNAIVTEA